MTVMSINRLGKNKEVKCPINMASSSVRENSQKRKKGDSEEETLEDLVEQMQAFLDQKPRKRKKEVGMNCIAILVRGFESTITSIVHDRNRRISTSPTRTNPQHQVLKVINF